MSLNTVRNGYFSIVILMISGLGMFLVWLRQLSYGVGINTDSVLYLSLAENLMSGEGFVSWLGTIPVPLFSFILSVIISLGDIDVLSAAAYLNIITFGLSTLILMAWLSFKLRNRFIIIYMGIAYAISPMLGHEHAIALTEPLFILFVVTSLFALDKFLNNNKGYWVVLCAVFAALSLLTRLIGFSLIISTLIILAISTKSLHRGIKYMVIYLSITMSAIGVYLGRNLVTIGRFVPQQWNPRFNNLYSIDAVTSAFIKWIFGNIGFDYIGRISGNSDVNNILIRIIILVIVMILIGYMFVRLRRRELVGEGMGFKELATPLIFILTYTFMIYISLAIYGTHGSVIERFIIPVYAPFLMILALFLDRVWSMIYRKSISVSCAFLMNIWLIPIATDSYSDIREWQDYGLGYLSKNWDDSETINYLRSNPITGLIYSNEIRAVYVYNRLPYSGRTYFQNLPSELPLNNVPIKVQGYNSQNIDMQDMDMYLIWFHDQKSYKPVPIYYDFLSFSVLQNLQIVAVFEDSLILRSSPESAPESEDLKSTILEYILRDAQLVAANPGVDIYLDNERLIYISTLCNNAGGIESPFFLHVYPVDRADIFQDRRNNGLDFNKYDFSFSLEGFFWGERCAAIRNLPDYDIKAIRTGQYTNEGELWGEEFQPELLHRHRTS